MYKDKFILAIKHNNKVLRETKNIVQLPFNSEYSLLLKNENSKRALVKIKIDSQDVLYGSEIVLDANKEITIERFLQNNEYGNRFKFVKLSDNNVKDKDNPENGLIEVDFWLEKDFEMPKIIKEKEYIPYPVYPDPFDYPWIKPWREPYYPWYEYRPLTIYGNTTSNLQLDTVVGSAGLEGQGLKSEHISHNAFFCSSNIQAQNINSVENLGATVEGSKSEQKFQSIYTREKDLSTHVQIRLYLRATENPLYVEDTKNKFCSQCGKKIQYKDKFCSSCGFNVEV